MPCQYSRTDSQFESGDHYRNSFTSKQQEGSGASLKGVTSTQVQCKATDEHAPVS